MKIENFSIKITKVKIKVSIIIKVTQLDKNETKKDAKRTQSTGFSARLKK